MDVNPGQSRLPRTPILLLVVVGLLGVGGNAKAGGFCHKSRAILLVPETESRVVERVVEEPAERVIRRRVIRREVVEDEPEPETEDREATPSPQTTRAATPPAKNLPRSVLTRDPEPEPRRVVRTYVREVPVRREVVREYVREVPAEREIAEEEPEVETRYVRVREVEPVRVRVVRAAPVEERTIVVREVRATEAVLVKKHCHLFGR